MATTEFASGFQIHPLTSDAPPHGQPIAHLEAATKRYGTVTALDKLTLSLYPGEVVALLGPNGAGKTTAVRLLLGLVAPTSGSVRVMGRDPRDSETRAAIGAMLQVTRVPDTLRVREHIDLFRSYYPNPLPASEIVRIARLQGMENTFYGKLSGGQKQRVLFALALSGNPSLVFLDEPTVGMDIESRRALWDQVRSLSARGKTVLLTTHYLDEADALASRIVVLGDLPSVLSVDQDREAVIVTATEADRVVAELFRRDPTLRGLEVSTAGLEDAFLALTSSEG